MQNKNEKNKPIFNINVSAIKNVLKSKEVQKAAKELWKSHKKTIDSFDIK